MGATYASSAPSFRFVRRSRPRGRARPPRLGGSRRSPRRNGPASRSSSPSSSPIRPGLTWAIRRTSRPRRSVGRKNRRLRSGIVRSRSPFTSVGTARGPPRLGTRTRDPNPNPEPESGTRIRNPGTASGSGSTASRRCSTASAHAAEGCNAISRSRARPAREIGPDSEPDSASRGCRRSESRRRATQRLRRPVERIARIARARCECAHRRRPRIAEREYTFRGNRQDAGIARKRAE